MDFIQLCSQPEANRDDNWEKSFLEGLPSQNLTLIKSDPQTGPDGWPYLMAKIEADSTEPVAKVLDWLSDKGIGLAINPHKQIPDYIFSYGALWGFKQYGTFVSSTSVVNPGQFKIEKGQQIKTGNTSEDYFPAYAKNIVKEFLGAQNVKEPKLLVVNSEGEHYDLCFSLESLGSPDPSEHKGVLEAMSWFFPDHYSLALISEKNMPQFFNL